MNSLFVVSLPRSFSSFTYQTASKILGLKQPMWTSDGEILNADRYVMCQNLSNNCLKFTTKNHPLHFRQIIGFLDEVTVRGYAYKDVIQPFIVSEWLKAHFVSTSVLRIKRHLSDVVFSMLQGGWLYPAEASSLQRSWPDKMVIEGLARADMALDEIPGERVDFDALVTDETVLRDALTKLYPSVVMTAPRYLDEDFCRYRDEIFHRRTLDGYKRIEEKVQQVLESIK